MQRINRELWPVEFKKNHEHAFCYPYLTNYIYIFFFCNTVYRRVAGTAVLNKLQETELRILYLAYITQSEDLGSMRCNSASFGERFWAFREKKCRYYDRSKLREPLTQRRNVTFHNTFLSKTAVQSCCTVHSTAQAEGSR